MTTIYKLTDGYNETRGGTVWTPGEWLEVAWGGEMCRPGCLHAYSDPLMAVLMDPVHAETLPAGKLWVAEGNVLLDDGTKLGCDRMRILREHELPEVSTEQRIRWAVLCARAVYRDASWLEWAERWLSGEDRSADVAASAAHAAFDAAYADAAARAAAHAAYAAAYADDLGAVAAARAAANAANAATTAYAAAAAHATYAAHAAYAAAYAATTAAAAAHAAAVLQLAVQAITEEP